MNFQKQRAVLAVLILGGALGVAGCGPTSSKDSAGQKLDRASEKVAASTTDAANKTAEVMDDAALTAKVKAAILAEPGLRTLQIGVETKDSVVTLSGAVDSASMKDRAKKLAGGVAGVRGVVDNLVSKTAQSG